MATRSTAVRPDSGPAQGPAPAVDSMSVTLLPGRITNAAVALEQGVEAEQLGYSRVWIPERYNIKETSVLMSGIAARTSRIGVGPGPLSLGARSPLVMASVGATMLSMYGSRYTLGVGRGPGNFFHVPQVGFDAMVDWIDIIKRLWRGEVVNYDGPAGTYENVALGDLPEEPPPPVVFFHLGGPRASRLAAHPVFDGVATPNLSPPEAVRQSFEWTRAECSKIGRDPATLRFIAPVTSAPDMDDDDTRLVVGARLVIYLQAPQVAERLVQTYGLDAEVLNEIYSHPLFASLPKEAVADSTFHRGDLLEVARLVPESWMRKTGAIGSSEEVLQTCLEHFDAGADEINFYGSTPRDNARVLGLWRDRLANGTETP